MLYISKPLLLVILPILGIISISCEEEISTEPPTEPTGEIQPGWWNASADFGGFDFLVNSSSTYITEIKYEFSDWDCAGITHSGSVTVSSDLGWPITDRQFEIETDMNPSPFDREPITISGTFAESGDQASGTWEAVVNSTTCSGSWQGSY